MAMKVNDPAPPAKGQPETSAGAAAVVMSEAQFSRLVELLTPGYELSKLMLAEHNPATKQNRKASSDHD